MVHLHPSPMMFRSLLLLLVCQWPTRNHINAFLSKDKVVFEAIQLEYREMASWYDWFWKSYTRETLRVPLDIATSEEMETFAKRPTMTLVDVGCGTGEFLKRFRSRTCSMKFDKSLLHIIGVEPSKEMLDQARPKLLNKNSLTGGSPIKLALRQAPAENLPLRSHSADVVVSTNAFHFFRDKLRALLEMKRVLKNSGTIVITDWCQNYWMVKMYHFLECIRWNGRFRDKYPGPLPRQKLLELLNEAGFTVQTHKSYLVRVFTVFPWGMQTIVAKKKVEQESRATDVSVKTVRK